MGRFSVDPRQIAEASAIEKSGFHARAVGVVFLPFMEMKFGKPFGKIRIACQLPRARRDLPRASLYP
jgi:hypothetical protein